MIVEQIKYIAVTDTKILSCCGWKFKDCLRDCQIRLFPKPAHVAQFFENKRIKPKYRVQKVIVRIEVLEDDNYNSSKN